jgi:hypothetical protein
MRNGRRGEIQQEIAHFGDLCRHRPNRYHALAARHADKERKGRRSENCYCFPEGGKTASEVSKLSSSDISGEARTGEDPKVRHSIAFPFTSAAGEYTELTGFPFGGAGFSFSIAKGLGQRKCRRKSSTSSVRLAICITSISAKSRLAAVLMRAREISANTSST